MNMFKPTKASSPDDYISQIDEPRKSQIKELDRLIQNTRPKLDRKMYHSVIGYGSQHLKYETGREVDWFKIGLASQKNYISIYINKVEDGEYLAEKSKDVFPKASIGKSCIRFKKIEDINLDELKKLLKKA